MACTSIFYFIDANGYQYFTKVYGKVPDIDTLSAVAACQRYYLLGHAAMAHGLLWCYRSYIEPVNKAEIANWPAFFLKAALVSFPLGVLFFNIGGLGILGECLQGLALVAATLALALAIPLRQQVLILFTGLIYAVALLKTLTSGFKEPVIVSILMLGLFLYPFYKRFITFTFIPIMLFLFTVLPTYIATFRQQVNSGNADAETAKAESLRKVREGLKDNDIAETNWLFLTERLSEISLFVKYKEATEERGQYYGLQIIGQTAVALVPRILWPSKPITENVAMVRVIENGIVEDYSVVSAKPQYVVDGYLSAGVAGIWLALFLYGSLAQLLCNYAQRNFGGYLMGTSFIYTGVFRSLWRGNCFEFIFNNILYGFLLMLLLTFLFKKLKILVPVASRALLVKDNAALPQPSSV